MNVASIIKKYLSENDFDGLVNCDADCGCLLADLFPCDDPAKGCEAAYNDGPVGSYDFFMVTKRNKKNPTDGISQIEPEISGIRCQWCGCPVEDHSVDDEERRECKSCECKQYIHNGVEISG